MKSHFLFSIFLPILFFCSLFSSLFISAHVAPIKPGTDGWSVVRAIGCELDTVYDTVLGIQTQVETIGDQITDIQTHVDTMAPQITDIQTLVDAMSPKVMTILATVTTMAPQVTDIQTNVDFLVSAFDSFVTSFACAPGPILQTAGTITLSISGNYCLASDFVGTFSIIGNDITFDLNNRKLTGTISATNVSNINLLNGFIMPLATVTNSDPAAVKLIGINNITINKCVIDCSLYGATVAINGRDGIDLTSCNDVRILECSITGGPGGTGVFPSPGNKGGNGINGNSCNTVFIENCVVFGSAGGSGNGQGGGTGGNGVAFINNSTYLQINSCEVIGGNGGNGSLALTGTVLSGGGGFGGGGACSLSFNENGGNGGAGGSNGTDPDMQGLSGQGGGCCGAYFSTSSYITLEKNIMGGGNGGNCVGSGSIFHCSGAGSGGPGLYASSGSELLILNNLIIAGSNGSGGELFSGNNGGGGGGGFGGGGGGGGNGSTAGGMGGNAFSGGAGGASALSVTGGGGGGGGGNAAIALLSMNQVEVGENNISGMPGGNGGPSVSGNGGGGGGGGGTVGIYLDAVTNAYIYDNIVNAATGGTGEFGTMYGISGGGYNGTASNGLGGGGGAGSIGIYISNNSANNGIQIMNCTISGADGGSAAAPNNYANGGDAVFTGTNALYTGVNNCVIVKAGRASFGGTAGLAINDFTPIASSFLGSSAILNNIAYNVTGNPGYYRINSVLDPSNKSFNVLSNSATLQYMLNGNFYLP